jgi:thiosulfate/3-mercaptopyruvate sulfurtransferase
MRPCIDPALRRGALLLSLLVVVATPTLADDHPPLRQHMLVSTQWLADHLDEPDLVVVHVGHGRTGYQRGHIPGAVFLEPRDLLVERDGIPNELPDLEVLTDIVRSLGIDGDSRVVLYEDAAGLFATRVYYTLAYLGLADRVALLDGHLRRWVAEERPTTTHEPMVEPTDWSPTVDGSVRVELAEVVAAVEALSGAGAALLIDARTPEQFRGERRGHGTEVAGRIPGAVNVPWLAQIESVRDPLLLPVDALRELYASAGVEARRPVIVYDATGMHASYTFFVLRYLGHDPRLYDGSMAEWSRTEPVATGE